MDGPCARFSRNGRYRYLLTRPIGTGPRVTFVMLNPSTADAFRNDPTIRKCIGFAQRWQCGQLTVINLFALRTPSPRDLHHDPDPVGPRNRATIIQIMQQLIPNQDIIIAAWGTHGQLHNQAEKSLRLMNQFGIEIECLGHTMGGHPRHPLYVRYETKRTPLKV